MTEINDAEDFLAGLGQLGEEKVDAGGGRMVTVRGMTRAENLKISKAAQGKGLSTAEVEQLVVATGLVAPKMTPHQVERWQERGTSGALERVVQAIQRLSDLQEDAGKAEYKSVPSEP